MTGKVVIAVKRLIITILGCMLSLSLVVTANAAPAGASGKPKQAQGLKNAKKVMQSKLERDKKVRELKKQAYASRKQAQRGK